MKIIGNVNSINHTWPLNLLELYNERGVNQISRFCNHTEQLVPNELVAAYHRARKSAPHRQERNKRYFVGHSGVTNSGGYSNRREEHLAVALWNSTQEYGPLALLDGRTLEFLDYQFPLKAQRSDKGIGKVDLFGLFDNTTPCVIELKIHAAGKGSSDTPLRAFLEALAYCAIVEANARDIAREVLDNCGKKLIRERPDLVLMAPEEYWLRYINHQKAGEWWPALRRLADQLNKSFGLVSHFIGLRDAKFSMGLEGQKPQLLGNCSLINLSDLLS